MLTLLLLSICASAFGVYKYVTLMRNPPVHMTVWEEGHMVTLQTETGRHLNIIEASWYAQDITTALQQWCHDTAHVAFMATDSVLTDITNLDKPPRSADPYLTINYQ